MKSHEKRVSATLDGQLAAAVNAVCASVEALRDAAGFSLRRATWRENTSAKCYQSALRGAELLALADRMSMIAARTGEVEYEARQEMAE